MGIPMRDSIMSLLIEVLSFTLDFPVPVQLSVNLNSAAQVPYIGNLITKLENDAGSLEHIFEGNRNNN